MSPTVDCAVSSRSFFNVSYLSRIHQNNSGLINVGVARGKSREACKRAPLWLSEMSRKLAAKRLVPSLAGAGAFSLRKRQRRECARGCLILLESLSGGQFPRLCFVEMPFVCDYALRHRGYLERRLSYDSKQVNRAQLSTLMIMERARKSTRASTIQTGGILL